MVIVSCTKTMIEHYRKNYDSFNEIYLRKIVKGKSLKKQTDHLLEVAANYIKRANITNETEQAIKLNKFIGRYSPDTDEMESFFALINEVGSKHDLVHDHLFIIAAYENYAKAILLKKQCVVHRISKPSALRALQKKRPVHFRTLKSKKYNQSYYLTHNTIGINELLLPSYIEKIGLNRSEVYSLKECRNMRNNIHFGGAKTYSYDNRFYNGIAKLRDRICS